MDPGQLRYRVEIFLPSTVQDVDFGDMNLNTGTSYYRFSQIIHKGGDSGEENSVEQFQKVLKFIFRYEVFFKSIRETGVIIYDGERYRINSVRFRGGGNKCYVEIMGKTFI